MFTSRLSRIGCIICIAIFCSLSLTILNYVFIDVGGVFSCEFRVAETFGHQISNCWTGTLTTAGIYFRSQRPLFRAAAASYGLHWVFAQGHTLDSTDVSYESMVGRRLSSIATLMKHMGRDDTDVEKNKCLMYRFFENNKIPFSPILYFSYDQSVDIILNEVRSGRLLANISRWPVFLKACHLTAGSSDGVLRINSRTRTPHGWKYDAKTTHTKTRVTTDEELATFVSSRYSLKALDIGRAWDQAANALGEHLKPGFILQSPAQLSYVPETKTHTMYEVKTYVLWGRPFLGMLLADGDPIENSLLIRGKSDHDIEFVPQGGVASLLYLHRVMGAHDLQWLVDEGHGACIWPLAAKAAKAMKIDEVRIDIFVTRGQPQSCIANEISLSSGHGQGSFRNYMARLWAEPHVLHSFRTWGSAASKAVYLLEPDDL